MAISKMSHVALVNHILWKKLLAREWRVRPWGFEGLAPARQQWFEARAEIIADRYERMTRSRLCAQRRAERRDEVLHVFYCLTCGEEVYRAGPMKRYTRNVARGLSDDERARLVYTQHRQARHGKLSAGIYTYPLHEQRRGPDFAPLKHTPHDWRVWLPTLGVPVGTPALPDGEEVADAVNAFLRARENRDNTEETTQP